MGKEITFSPKAWNKLSYLTHVGDTEIGGFGILRNANELYVEDFVMVPQECSSAAVDFDDEGLADYTSKMLEKNLTPEQFFRVWIHTHPGSGPDPSGMDEKTFKNVLGKCQWAIMFILARSGDCYCRLRLPFNQKVELKTCVDYGQPLNVDSDEWDQEYVENVKKKTESYEIIGFSDWKDRKDKKDTDLQRYSDSHWDHMIPERYRTTTTKKGAQGRCLNCLDIFDVDLANSPTDMDPERAINMVVCPWCGHLNHIASAFERAKKLDEEPSATELDQMIEELGL